MEEGGKRTGPTSALGLSALWGAMRLGVAEVSRGAALVMVGPRVCPWTTGLEMRTDPARCLVTAGRGTTRITELL